MNEFIKAAGCYVKDSTDLGFGGKRFHCRISQPLEIYVSVVSFDGQLMEYAINPKINGKFDYVITDDSLYSNSILTADNFKSKKSFLHVNKLEEKKYRKKVADDLGAPFNPIRIDTARLAYQVLYDPINEYDYGTSCYDGAEPLGRVAAHYFSRKKDVTEIRSLISGCNPEGRIYAIELLLTKANDGDVILTSNDKMLIKKVIGLDLTIHTCTGCIGQRKKGNEIFSNFLLLLE